MTAHTAGYWLDDHDDDVPEDGDAVWEPPRHVDATRFVPRIGVTGTVGDTTLAFAAHLVAWSVSLGRAPLVITTDTTGGGGWQSAAALRLALAGVLDIAWIVGVVTESMDSEGARTLLNAVATELVDRYPDADVLLFVGSAQLAALPLNRELAHYTVGVLDANGQTDTATQPLIETTDLLVTHLPSSSAMARDEGASGEAMGRNSSLPTVRADCTSGQGLDDAFAVLWDDVLSA